MSRARRVVGPLSLARKLHHGPPAPSAIVRLLAATSDERLFCEIAQRFVPDEAEAILRPRGTVRDREAECCWAFCAAFERRHFPIYEVEEVQALVCCIPFQRMGWSYDAFHDLDQRTGTLLLRGICTEPYAGEVGARVPLLDALDTLGVPRELLLRIPAEGIDPARLHAVLDATRYAAAAEFADWTWGQTELAFLDCDDEVEIVDADWSEDNVQGTPHRQRRPALLRISPTGLRL